MRDMRAPSDVDDGATFGQASSSGMRPPRLDLSGTFGGPRRDAVPTWARPPGSIHSGAATPPASSDHYRRPRRTLTDNASEFREAMDDMLSTNAPWPTVPSAPPRRVDLSPAPLLRSQTLDSFGIDTPVSTRSQVLRPAVAAPLSSNSVVGSPCIAAADEWNTPPLTEEPTFVWPSHRPVRSNMPDFLSGVLSSSPDETQLHAEASVAIALEDERPQSGQDNVDQLTYQMRSMTMPERPVSVHERVAPLFSGAVFPCDSPPRISSPTTFSPLRRAEMKTSKIPPVFSRIPALGTAPYSSHALSSPDVAEFPVHGGFPPPHPLETTSPCPKVRDDGKWYGRPGTLRLGETAQAGYVFTSSPLDEDFPNFPRRPYEDSGSRRRTSHRARHDTRTAAFDHRLPARDDHRFDLMEVRGRLVEISADQHGSRLIQEKLDHATQEERDIVFHELFPEARRLMTDVFGNYVIQKLLEYGSSSQVQALGEQLERHVLQLSLGTYGCRVVQKAFEYVSEKQKILLGRELEPYVLDCVRDQNANHVIQKILEQVPSAHLDFVANAFRGHVPTLASHCYSCRVLQRIFAYCSEEQRRPLLEEMHADTLRLMQDQYGNYVIQWVLQHGDMRDRLAVINQTKGHLLQLARHKFASNVVEHVIEVAPTRDRRELLDELLVPLAPQETEGIALLLEGAAPLCVATIMMQDQYANYVLQRFLQVIQGDDRARLVAAVRPVLVALRQRQAAMAAPGAAPYTGSIRVPGGGHIGNKPLMAIERLLENGPDRGHATR